MVVHRRCAFTLVEIMIVVGLIGILATMTAPLFINSRDASRRTLCINNLIQIDRAKDQFVTETGGSPETLPTWTEILPFVKDGPEKLYCPAAPDGQRVYSNCYRINEVRTGPDCLVSPDKSGAPDHSLAFRPAY